jgi:hypothetical protein
VKALLAGILACGLFSLPFLDIRGLPEETLQRIMVEVEAPGLNAAYLVESVLFRTLEALSLQKGLHKLYYGVFDEKVIFHLVTDPRKSSLSDIRYSFQGLRPSWPHQAGTPGIYALPRAGSSAGFFFSLEECGEIGKKDGAAHDSRIAHDSQIESRADLTARRMRQLREELLALPAVRSVLLRGLPDTEIEITLDPERLTAARLSPLSVENALRGALFKISAGVMENSSHRTDLVLESSINSLEELRKLPIPLAGKEIGAYSVLGEMGRVSWSPPLYSERVLRGNCPGGIVYIHFDPEAGYFEELRDLRAVSRILDTSSWIGESSILYRSLSGSTGPLLFLLFGITAAVFFLYRLRTALHVCAPPALIVALHAFTGTSLGPGDLTGMGAAALGAALFLHYIEMDRIMDRRTVYGLCTILAVEVLVPLVSLAGLPAPFSLQIFFLHIALFLLLEGLYRRTEDQDVHGALEKFLPPCSTARLRLFVLFPLLVLAAAAPLSMDFSPGIQMYAALPSLSLPGGAIPRGSGGVSPGEAPGPTGMLFSMDYPCGPPDAFNFQAEHWLSLLDPGFFIIAAGPQVPPENMTSQGLIFPLSHPGRYTDLEKILETFLTEAAGRFHNFNHNFNHNFDSGPNPGGGIFPVYSLHTGTAGLSLTLAPETLAASNLTRPLVIRHIELALRGIEIGQISGILDGRDCTVRLKYGDPSAVKNLPVFPGNTLPVRLSDIASPPSKQEKLIFLGAYPLAR